MAIAYVQSNGATTGDGTSVAVSLNGVTAGNLIVAYVKHEEPYTATCVSVSDGTSSFTLGTESESHDTGDPGDAPKCGVMAWLLSANAGNKTYTATFSESVGAPRICIWEISGGTFELDDYDYSGTGNGTSIVSGGITTTADNTVLIAGSSNSSTATNMQINATAYDELEQPSSSITSWMRIVTSTVTGATATATNGASWYWVCQLISFKLATEGSSASVSPSASPSASISASPSASISASISISPSASVSSSPSASPSASVSASPSASPSSAISGSTCWGHVTGVTQDNTRTFATNWTGTGTISGTGDSEAIDFDVAEQYMESEIVYTDSYDCTITLNSYISADSCTVKYRTGATAAACAAASWEDYAGSFASSGYVQIRLEE